MTQDVNVPDNDQPDVVSEMLAAARASRGTVDGSPYSSGRQDEIDDLELAHEYQMSADATLADENAALRVVARTRANDSAYSAWMTAQWFEARRKQHEAEARAVDVSRQLAEALKDSEPAHAALMAAQAKRDDLVAELKSLWKTERENDKLRREADDLRREIATLRARIAELEQAVIFAEPAAPGDDVTRHLLNLKVSELAPLEALTKLMELKRMALESAPAPDTETPATPGDKPRKVWTEDVKRAILTALVEVPRNLSEMRADGWMAEVPDRQFAACILEMSRTWQLMRPVPGAPEGTYELTPDGADSARAMLADADDDVTVALMDERARPPMKLTPPARKPDAAA